MNAIVICKTLTGRGGGGVVVLVAQRVVRLVRDVQALIGRHALRARLAAQAALHLLDLQQQIVDLLLRSDRVQTLARLRMIGVLRRVQVLQAAVVRLAGRTRLLVCAADQLLSQIAQRTLVVATQSTQLVQLFLVLRLGLLQLVDVADCIVDYVDMRIFLFGVLGLGQFELQLLEARPQVRSSVLLERLVQLTMSTGRLTEQALVRAGGQVAIASDRRATLSGGARVRHAERGALRTTADARLPTGG